MKTIIFLLLTVLPLSYARAESGFFVDPHAAVGFNPAQGTHVRLGLDMGMHFTENIAGGVGAYFAAGEDPSNDREIGAGPFVSYILPLTSFLMFTAREDVLYVDQHNPVSYFVNGQEQTTHTNETGVISATSPAIHIYFTPNFVLSGGYRLVLALANSDLDNDRSGAFVGFSIGI